jgi:hypothetical protein
MSLARGASAVHGGQARGVGVLWGTEIAATTLAAHSRLPADVNHLRKILWPTWLCTLVAGQ